MKSKAVMMDVSRGTRVSPLPPPTTYNAVHISSMSGMLLGLTRGPDTGKATSTIISIKLSSYARDVLGTHSNRVAYNTLPP